MTLRIPSKKQTLLAYLERGVAMVHLDARRPGVSVPQQYAQEAHLRLNLSYRYSIRDMEISDKDVRATLSFGGRPFHCLMPWEAVFGITSHDGDGQVWPEDLPAEVMRSMAEREERGAPQPTPSGTVTPVALSAVQGDGIGDPRPQPSSEATKTPPQQRHLRLVR
jgi:stringent starvation protein B